MTTRAPRTRQSPHMIGYPRVVETLMDQESCMEAGCYTGCYTVATESRGGLSATTYFEYEVWLRTRDSNPEPCG